MKDISEEIEEARSKVAYCRIRAERPGSRLEDDYALEKARTRLLTLELRQLKRDQAPRHQAGNGPVPKSREVRSFETKRAGTKSEQKFGSARERAEDAFARLRHGRTEKRGAV
ncbi:hypothetical protein WNZ15_22555 [Roseibium sp. AS2]|uniref:hypothetical protein n=1 Tax=Roseibium sp. AS2 TaxID=3135781 RepID=UPI00316C07AE